ncbi:MAG TPA: DUF4143 domain-containing protein [Sphaerochaeta sp.]|nr:DUF4143 domain-containing protein [Sphaerochaeta sp.]
MLLRRKIDRFLDEWKQNPDRLPLIVKGARQVGKTVSIQAFAKRSYPNVIEINFALQKQYRDIFDEGFEVDVIIKNISLRNPSLRFVEHQTLIFFDELQDCVNCATSLKPFKLDGRYDVICSGSMMGINYSEIESNSVGYKQDYELQSLDFEEYLWAKGYQQDQIEDLFDHMVSVRPLSKIQQEVMFDNFREYLVLGGMPAVVKSFVTNRHYGGTLQIQRQILADYEEDITKYAGGLDKAKIISVYRKIPVFLGRDNKKFRISQVARGARSREYIGVVEWLESAAIVNVCHCMSQPALPLKGNYDPGNYKLYFRDTGLLVASLDEEAQQDLRNNRNFNTYKGALYENIVSEMLAKQGYANYFYRDDKNSLEIDFLVRDAHSLIPIEVKANDGPSRSMQKMVESPIYKDVQYGIKLGHKNIGRTATFYTFPYYLTFLLRRFLSERSL